MLIILLLLLLIVIGLLLAFTRWKTSVIERDAPGIGELIDVGGFRMNSVLLPAGPAADLPPILFIHGASGNLRDQLFAFRGALQGRADLLFVDRPGHGYSERGGPENGFPDGQADAIARLMGKRGIDKAIIAGHSFGAAIAASFALKHPDKTLGLLFLAPATHPWPGGIAWYYRIASTPWLGSLFARLFSLPAGLAMLDAATNAVFAPNPRPADYDENTAPQLVLRPKTFVYNAIDIANLKIYAARTAPLYGDIRTPAVIVTGDRDDIVAVEIHSHGLAVSIPGAKLLTVHGLGHKPDYVTTGLAIAALEWIAGHPVDLAAARTEAQQEVLSATSICR